MSATPWSNPVVGDQADPRTVDATCTVVVGASGQKCGEPAVASFTATTGERFHECRYHLHRTGFVQRDHVAPPPDVPMVPLRKLTAHQRDTLNRLIRANRAVDVRDFGARATLDRLVAKGWATVELDVGPRGGEIRRYRAR